jgi:hypothetical protein
MEVYMAAPDPTPILSKPKPQILRVFISYSREDEKIAVAVFDALRTALGTFADVFMDNTLHFGLNFLDEIKKRLDDTDLLVVIDSPTLKPNFSYTGIELGYYMGVMGRNLDPERPRRIVPIYHESPPDMIAENEGIRIGISRATLALSLEEYTNSLQINSDNSMVRFLDEFQEIADKLREKNGFPKVVKRPEEEDLCGLVRKMQLSIFSHLKTNPESTLKPQKQITIKTSDSAVKSAGMDLPADALLIPVGTGNPLAIFGLPNQEISWRDFSTFAKNSKFGDTWLDAITSVLASSLQGQMDVDNSQLVVSNDARNAFRVILTTGTRYFNGIREFNLYFVEYLRPKEFGDPNTTLILKGLELCCRFRFLFLEKGSEFYHMNIRIGQEKGFQDLVRNLERELNLLRRDALEAGLDKAAVWADFVDWSTLQKMSEEWRPLEARIRECCAKLREAKENPGALPELRDSLAAAVEQLETTIRPLNTQLICGLTDSLKKCCSCV